MKISDIFNIIQGHQITDEEIYMSVGGYPIYTGNNEVKGYWDKTIVSESMLPCLTYPTKAFAGVISLQEELFDANNTAVLYLKDEYKDKVELEWFKFILPSYFFNKATSKEGVSYLNKEIVQNIEIEIPDIETQKKQVKILKELEEKEKQLKDILSKIEKVLNKHILLNNYGENEKVLLNSILSYVSRNDALSEEGIYKMYPRGYETAKVLSGSTDDISYGEIDDSLDNIHYLRGRQALHIVTRGKAGKLTFIPNGVYATNTNAFLLYIDKDKWEELNIKDEYQEEIYLKFLKIYLQPFFYSVCSSSDVAVFPLTEVMREMFVPKFKYDESFVEFTQLFDVLERREALLTRLLDQVSSLRRKLLVG